MRQPNGDIPYFFGSSDEDKDKMTRVVSNLINKGVDGLIIVPCDNSEKSIASLVNNNIPIVLFGPLFSGNQCQLCGVE